MGVIASAHIADVTAKILQDKEARAHLDHGFKRANYRRIIIQ